MRFFARSLGAVLILLGAGTLAWAGTTWLWKDPFTTAYTALEQRELAREYQRRAQDFPPPILASAGGEPAKGEPAKGEQANGEQAIAETARRYREGLRPGDPIGRLHVPRLGLDIVMVEGTGTAPLKKGPGRHRSTFLPGEGELVYIAGHRTTYSAPFSDIDQLREGDAVVVELPYGTFEYRITGHKIVKATDVEVLESKGREVIALQACHPRFFASHRYIAYAVPAESAR